MESGSLNAKELQPSVGDLWSIIIRCAEIEKKTSQRALTIKLKCIAKKNYRALAFQLGNKRLSCVISQSVRFLARFEWFFIGDDVLSQYFNYSSEVRNA